MAQLRRRACLTALLHRFTESLSFLFFFFFFLHFHQEPPLAQRSVYPTLNPHPNNNPLPAQVQSARLHSTPERQRSTRTDFCVNLLPFSCTAEGKRPGFLSRSYEFFMRRIIFSLFFFSPPLRRHAVGFIRSRLITPTEIYFKNWKNGCFNNTSATVKQPIC